jgi:hypothetical protein
MRWVAEVRQLAFALLVGLGLACLAPTGVAQAQAVDLTGVWTNGRGDRIVIAQSGVQVTLIPVTGRQMAGDLDGVRLTLRREFGEADVSAAPAEVRAQIAARHLPVIFRGTVQEGGRRIVGRETRPGGIRWDAGNHVTGITEQTTEVTLMAQARYRLRWRETPATAGNRLTLTGPRGETFDRPIAGIKYVETGAAMLSVGADCPFPCKAPAFTVERIEVRNLIGPAAARTVYAGPGLRLGQDPNTRETVATLDQDQLLHAMQSAVNVNVLEATAILRLAGDQRTIAVRSTNVAHLLRQKLLVFLPGVLGSSLYVEINRPGPARLAECARMPSGTEKEACLHGEEIEAFPRFSLGIIDEGAGPIGRQYLRMLENGPDGHPRPGNEATKIDIFRSFGVGEGSSIDTVPVLSWLGRKIVPVSLVYGIEKLDAVKAPAGHPRLSINGRPAAYYIYQPWPYDWRGRLEEAVAAFTAADDGRASVDPPYATPPPLAALLRVKRSQNPFLGDKVALVGHSTGGLIIRGILLADHIADHVDKAGFIDVPFYGAPKAYFVYLTGDMDVAFLGNTQMMLLAPNMPILYYLAPNRKYLAPVARIRGNLRSRVLGAGSIVNDLLEEARRNGLYDSRTKPAPDWNRNLEGAAELYYIKIYAFPPKIPWKDMMALVSVHDPEDQPTIGTISVAPNGVVFDAVPGDGTVPLVSQRGDLANHPEARTKTIPGGPAHTLAPSEEFVWAEIIKQQRIAP